MPDLSLQQQWFPDGLCFGCGPANRLGLGLRSFPEGEEVVAEWEPQPMYRAGPEVIAGGVIATLLDCHTGAAVIRAVGMRDGTIPYVDGDPWVTASFAISLHRPTPLDRPLHLRARVTELERDHAVASGAMLVGGERTASITAEWRHLESRP